MKTKEALLLGLFLGLLLACIGAFAHNVIYHHYEVLACPLNKD